MRDLFNYARLPLETRRPVRSKSEHPTQHDQTQQHLTQQHPAQDWLWKSRFDGALPSSLQGVVAKSAQYNVITQRMITLFAMGK